MKTLQHLLLNPEVQSLLDHFCACFRIRILIYDAAGEVQKVGLNQQDAPYCRLLQEKWFGEERCLQLDREMREQAVESRRMVSYCCHAGLHEAVCPLQARGRLLGHAMIGQFRTEATPPLSVREAARRRGIQGDLIREWDALPYIEKGRTQSVLQMFSTLVDYIITKNWVTGKEYALLEAVTAYLEKNSHRRVPLEEVARSFHRSPSTISHMFKKKAGISFKRFQTELRLKQFEDYLEANPDAGIAEAALSAGYNDPLYFSNLYRRYRGFAPSAFAKTCR